MAPPATESAVLTLHPNLDLTSGDAAIALTTALSTIRAQPGCQRVAWGRKVENPDQIHMLIDWDTLTSHTLFIASPAYTPFRTSLQPLLTAPPSLTHTLFAAPTPPATTAAPVTEIASFYFPADFETAAWSAPWEVFAARAGAEAQGLVGLVAGWGAEEVEHAGVKGKVWTALIGWESVGAHMAYREEAGFKETIAALRELVGGIEMHHVEFKGV